MMIERICRFPVKSLTAEELDKTLLSPGDGIAGDRLFAIAHGQSKFDAANPEHQRKTEFVVLMTHENLAALKATFDQDAGILKIEEEGRTMIEGNPFAEDDQKRLGRFLATRAGAGPAKSEAARLVSAPGHMFSDVAEKCLSLINLASVRALEERLGAPIDPLRFRGNIVFSGAAAWEELKWADKSFRIGGAVLKGIAPIPRCPATDVNPETAHRDMNIPGTLVREFGHPNMGVYATVVEGGKIAAGDAIELLD